jgi:hypothetical protein
MTRRQIAFCRAYFECKSGAEAARRAGYSERTARQIAWKIKHKSRVDFETLYHAYSIITLPAWPFTPDGRILKQDEIAAVHKAFFESADLPGWFLKDVKEGRYTPEI